MHGQTLYIPFHLFHPEKQEETVECISHMITKNTLTDTKWCLTFCPWTPPCAEKLEPELTPESPFAPTGPWSPFEPFSPLSPFSPLAPIVPEVI